MDNVPKLAYICINKKGNDMRTSKSTEISSVHNISIGYQFSITHCDGFIAKEKVSKIIHEKTETREEKGVGAQGYVAVGFYENYFFVCESCAVYTLAEIKTAINEK